ncbi:hypothetical protein BGW39_005112 [Mortierella sp. 14UC]|nr:hypothetical protein BGW39_005112 [Mortierella sp. 14UC]
MAPSSSVLQSDYLIIDENERLGEHLDMAKEAPTPSTTQASPAGEATGTDDAAAAARASKRVRYSFSDDGQQRPTAADLSVLQPVIQPNTQQKLDGQQHGHHTHHHNISRGRSVADLLPSSTDVAPIDMDEDASAALGEPVDSSLGVLAMEVEVSEEELAHARKHGPVTGRVSSAAAFLEPKKRLATDPITAPHPASSNPGEGAASTATQSSSFQATPSLERKRSLSISSCSTTPGHSHGHNSHLADKKGLKREVKIQLLDDMESKPILEEARRASIDQQREARDDKKHPPTSSSSKATKTSDKIDEEEEEGEGEDTVLPKEDPSIHDWDQEELEDEDLNYDDDDDDELDSIPSPASSLTSGNTPREETISSLQKRQRKLERDRRRAVFLSSQPTSDNDDSDSNPTHHHHHNPADVDEDKDDPFLDPERDSAFMSEAQEADTHNVHLRLENQREFQDAAGLDLGEGEAASNVVNEDGQYGGMIEPDDEGDDFWENR